MNSSSKSEPVVIKKYANRRLYNTETSSYVTLEHLSQMVKDGRDFVVKDAKTGEDITRSVLTQIIFEEENKGQTLLPIKFLRQLISFYGDGLETVIPEYLESTMSVFAQNQERYRKYIEENLGVAGAFTPPQDFMGSFQEMARQNMAAFEKATRMFSPFGAPVEPEVAAGEEAPRKEAPRAAVPGFDLLQSQLAAMQRQLDALTGKKK